jgi:hypothetical protein
MCLADAEIAAGLSYAEQEKSEGTGFRLGRP